MGGMGKLGVIALAAILCLAPGPAAIAAGETVAKAELNADGMYTQDWFLESFLMLAEDLQEAEGEGKGFAIIWEQRGCPYCRETHLVNFAQPEIQNYIKKHFTVLQLNLRGDREVTAFDGEKLTERALAKKLGVRFTPTVTFHAWNKNKAGDGKGAAAELSRMTGYYRPFHFLMAFKYIQEKAYQRQKFRPFINLKVAERKKQGKPVKFR